MRLTVVARSNYEAVKAKGISISSENHGNHTVRPYKGKLLKHQEDHSAVQVAYLYVVVKTVAEAQSTFDYIVCAHKAIKPAAAPAQIAAGVDEKKTTIVIIQNGVGNEEPFRKQFPSTTILSCVVRRTL